MASFESKGNLAKCDLGFKNGRRGVGFKSTNDDLKLKTATWLDGYKLPKIVICIPSHFLRHGLELLILLMCSRSQIIDVVN